MDRLDGNRTNSEQARAIIDRGIPVNTHEWVEVINAVGPLIAEVESLQAEAERLRAAIEKTIDPWDEKHGPLVDPVPPYVQELRGTLS